MSLTPGGGCSSCTCLSLSVQVHLLSTLSNGRKAFIIYSREVKAPANLRIFLKRIKPTEKLCHVVWGNFNGNFMVHCLEIIAVKNATTIYEEELFATVDTLHTTFSQITHTHTTATHARRMHLTGWVQGYVKSQNKECFKGNYKKATTTG